MPLTVSSPEPQADARLSRPNAAAEHLGILRSFLVGVLVLGLLGTVVELVFLEHYEEPLQFVPLVLIVIAFVVIGWHLGSHSTASLGVLVAVMTLFVLAGFLGILAHFNGSAEYQLELDPSIGTWELIEKIIRAKAPPLLAPGMMIELGLIGLAYAVSDPRYRVQLVRVVRVARARRRDPDTSAPPTTAPQE